MKLIIIEKLRYYDCSKQFLIRKGRRIINLKNIGKLKNQNWIFGVKNINKLEGTKKLSYSSKNESFQQNISLQYFSNIFKR